MTGRARFAAVELARDDFVADFDALVADRDGGTHMAGDEPATSACDLLQNEL